ARRRAALAGRQHPYPRGTGCRPRARAERGGRRPRLRCFAPRSRTEGNGRRPGSAEAALCARLRRPRTPAGTDGAGRRLSRRPLDPAVKTTVLIAEDEPLAAEALADWVAQLPELELVAGCADGDSALSEIRRLKPRLVLLDIKMPGLSGLQVAQALAAEKPRPAVIFTTAYDEHAVSAFELQAIDYLLKPFSRERFAEAVGRALQAGPTALEAAV